MIQRNPDCRAFGAARYRIAIINAMRITMTGHFTMSQTVTAAPPMPKTRPIDAASRPVNTIASALAASSVPVTTVSPSRTGRVFHTGRPSGTS